MGALQTSVLDQPGCALPDSIKVTDEAAAHLKAHPEALSLLRRMVQELAVAFSATPMLLDLFEEPDINRDRLYLLLLVSPNRPDTFDEEFSRVRGAWMRAHTRQERMALGLNFQYV